MAFSSPLWQAFRRGLAALHDPHGAAAISIVAGAVPLFSFLAIVTESGFTYNERRDLQNAADAAALAAAQTLLAGDAAGAVLDAQSWAAKNVDDLTTNDASISIDGTEITVSLAAPPAQLFTGSLGFGPSQVTATATANVATYLMDFEGLAEGAVVTELLSGEGISGEPVTGWVDVSVQSFGPVDEAMIFDATCTGGCTGGDWDLLQPTQGNVLIISEDGDSNDPDDEGSGGIFEFDFSNFGEGSVTVASLVFIDAEEDGLIELFSGGQVIHSEPLGAVADGEMEVRFIGGIPNVDFMRIRLTGSGAIDNIGYYQVIRLVE